MFYNTLFAFSAKKNQMRKMSPPVKFADYWDMNIPTQFYEEEFLAFENYMHFTGNTRSPTTKNPHANSEYHLEMFKKYEKFVQKENKKIFKEKMKAKNKADTEHCQQLQKGKKPKELVSCIKNPQKCAKVKY